ncbi:uncharacterized protein PAC_10071 [Phialocephala subalpina]|uniref:2EXR domain-containing protein n=1 Tax=Phialocephala subalpina TaxID=576137 RepID=A0A1L7X588_9HELO|nr:uncharacterized protein PAC_10071 [Phialocephala subalpina]
MAADNSVTLLDSGTADAAKRGTFHLFSELPTEIRIQIWQSSFVPRRVKLRTHAYRPRLDPRSTCGLLLVNNEAHSIFVEHYTKCLNDHGIQGIYINFSLDTLCINSGEKGLRKLLEQYPKAMRQVQWLDMRPNDQGRDVDWTTRGLQDMTSLRLLTFRWSHPDERKNDDSCWIYNIFRTASSMREVFKKRQEDTGEAPPVLAAFLTPCKIVEFWMKSHEFHAEHCKVNLKEPSRLTWDRFEIDMSKRWRESWPGREEGREGCTRKFWLATELE